MERGVNPLFFSMCSLWEISEKKWVFFGKRQQISKKKTKIGEKCLRKMRNNEKYSRNFFHKFLDVHLEKEWGTPRHGVGEKFPFFAIFLPLVHAITWLFATWKRVKAHPLLNHFYGNGPFFSTLFQVTTNSHMTFWTNPRDSTTNFDSTFFPYCFIS